MRPGRMDRKVEFGLPDLEVIIVGCTVIEMNNGERRNEEEVTFS